MKLPTKCAAMFALTVLVALPAISGRAEGSGFPFDQDLMMDVAPMRPSKRIPSLNIAENGEGQVDLWCRSLKAKVEVGEGTMTITLAPLTDTLPAYVSAGQCTPERMQADEAVAAALGQVTGWRLRGRAVELQGGAPIRFWPSSH